MEFNDRRNLKSHFYWKCNRPETATNPIWMLQILWQKISQDNKHILKTTEYPLWNPKNPIKIYMEEKSDESNQIRFELQSLEQL